MSGIRKWIFGAPETDALFKTRGFSCDSVSTQQHLEAIGSFFLFGYNNCLLTDNPESLRTKLESVKTEFKGFSYEGAAMGFALLDTISLKKNRFDRFAQTIGGKHIYMLHVGAGWAYAKLPVDVEKRMSRFDPLLKWLVMDGYGFCNAYFNTKKYVIDAKIPSLSDYGTHVFYQGLGRCLWFVEGANAERIAKRINSFPEKYAGDLWSGLGLASAYAGGVDKEVLEQLKQFGRNYILNLGQGAAFAAAARITAGNLVPHTDLACQTYCGIGAQSASEITEESRLAIDNISHDSIPAYESWRRKINNSLSKVIHSNLVT